VRRLRADPHGSSGAARGGRRRPSRRRQRTRSSGTASYLWRTWRSERNWTGTSASASGSVLPAAGSVRFRRLVCVQGNRPRASRLRARDAGAERKRRTGDAARRGGPIGNCAGMPDVFLQYTCVSRGGSAREQENPELRGGVGIANQSGSIVDRPSKTTTPQESS
jgi:hypothetical protein